MNIDQKSLEASFHRLASGKGTAEEYEQVKAAIRADQAAVITTLASAQGGVAIAASEVSNNVIVSIQSLTLVFSGGEADNLRELGLEKETNPTSELVRSRLAQSLSVALSPFADESARRAGEIEDEFYLAQTLDGLYKAVVLQLPPPEIDSLPASEIDDIVREMRSQVALLANYVDTSHLSQKLGGAYALLRHVLEKYLQITPKRRGLNKEMNIAIRQAWQDQRKGEEANLKGRSLSGTEVVTGISDFIADQARIKQKIEADYGVRDQALRSEFEHFLDNSKAQTAAMLAELAAERQWDDGQWRFDIEPQSWHSVHLLTFQHNFEKRSAVLTGMMRRHPRNVWMAIFFLFNVTPRTDSERADHLRIAASAALRVPTKIAHDEVRVTFALQAGRLAMERLQEKESGLAFGKGDPAYAKNVAAIWKTLAEYQPEFEPAEAVEARVFSTAASGALNEALAIANGRESGFACTALFAASMVRLTSLLGSFDKSLEWLRYGLRQKMLDVAECRTSPDLEPLRKSRQTEFAEATRVKCTVTFDPGLWETVHLKNNSLFSLHSVSLVVYAQSGAAIALDRKEVIAASGECNWNLFLTRVGGPWSGKRSIRYQLNCKEGTCSS